MREREKDNGKVNRRARVQQNVDIGRMQEKKGRERDAVEWDREKDEWRERQRGEGDKEESEGG